MNDLDFFDSALEGADLVRYVEVYARRVMEEAWAMDCVDTSYTSNGNSTRYQRCALRVLRDRLGSGIDCIRVPEIRCTGHAAGKRVRPFRGGM